MVVSSPLPVRIFISSPGDVNDERGIAARLLEKLAYDPFLRGRIAIENVAWDKFSGTPMLAHLPPQEAINQGLPRPSECHIVIVIFWTRMGTPLPFPQYQKHDASPYLSGTEWEFLDALDAAVKAVERGDRLILPQVVVYKRSEKVLFDPAAHDFEEKYEQWKRVQNFFNEFIDPAGAICKGYNTYETPEQFREDLESHLKIVIKHILETSTAGTIDPSGVSTAPLWEGLPFPGLRAFTSDDAPLFFGRGRETDALIKKLDANRFVAVVGSSGSGKSSLVAAGLIPRLQDNAIIGSKDWLLPLYDKDEKRWSGLRFTPGEAGDNPFLAIAHKLAVSTGQAAEPIADELIEAPESLSVIIQNILSDKRKWSQVFIYVDQFEELFTLVAEKFREPFIQMLAKNLEQIRIVVTMRADFYHRAVEYEALSHLLRDGSFPLAAPGLKALLQMIVGPAQRAGLEFEENLPERIMSDTGENPGALALMAFALNELYEIALPRYDGTLRSADYKKLGGVKGAIGVQAERIYSQLPFDDATKESLIHRVFQELTAVNERGVVTRRRVSLAHFADSPELTEFVNRFIDGRLLVSTRESDVATVEVAHEALLNNWPRLKIWLDQQQDDLYLLHQLEHSVNEWENNDCDPAWLWSLARLQVVFDVIERLTPSLTLSVRDFIVDACAPEDVWLDMPLPEIEQVEQRIAQPETLHFRRMRAGQWASLQPGFRPGIGLNGNGNPDILWEYIDRGSVRLDEYGEVEFQPFYISKYPVTNCQFQPFTQENVYYDEKWWNDLDQSPINPNMHYQNYPRDIVSWHQSVAYTRWLNTVITRPKYIPDGWEIRLPFEAEWQWVASSGNRNFDYPWGPEWDARFANTSESRLDCLVAVGMYPHGKSRNYDVHDLCGNVWEWCLNTYDNPTGADINATGPRVQRGGAYYQSGEQIRSSYRQQRSPDIGGDGFGFRLVYAAPV